MTVYDQLLARVRHYKKEPDMPFDMTKKRGLPPNQLYDIVRKAVLDTLADVVKRPPTVAEIALAENAIDSLYLTMLKQYG